MTTTSKFIQLTPYCLLEYVYNSKVINTRDSSFLRIINLYNNTLNYLSYNPSDFVKPMELTGNILDNSVQPIDINRWCHFDTDRPITFFEQQNRMLRFEGVWEDINSNFDITYDSVKLHLISGYSFDESAGLIARAAFVDSSMTNFIYVANYAYLKEDTNIKLNKRPIFLGNRTYDKYIEFSIPSVNDLSNLNNQIGSAFLSSNNGILQQQFDYNSAKLNILLYEVGNIAQENGQTILKTILPIDNDTNGLLRVDVDPFDPLVMLSAVVQESISGDYFELFPAFQGEYIEDFIYDRMARFGEEYMVIHDIELYEQISNFGDYTEIQTQRFTYFQEEGFDKPFKFRPVIENNNAITFAIDYTIRLYNKTNESQVIRKASLTYPNAKKYGRKMTKINIDASLQPMKIVNKIVNNEMTQQNTNYNYKKYSAISPDVKETITSYIPINPINICINNYTLFVDDIKTTNILYDGKKQYINNITFKELANSEVIYGQGDAVIYLTEFDNFIKFKIYKHDGANTVPDVYSSLVNSPNTVFYLVFFNSAGRKIRIEQFSDKSDIILNNLSTGEVLFKINTIDATEIIKSSDNRFYLTFENRTPLQVGNSTAVNIRSDFEVVLFNGKVDMASNFKIDNNNEFNLKQSMLLNIANQLDLLKTQTK